MTKVLTGEQLQDLHRPGWNWLGRNLENYKQMHAKVAADKGVGAEFKAARTLTEARKICYGHKKSNTR